MRRVVSLAILAMSLLAAPAPASDTRPLRALLIENDTSDGWRGATGAREALEQAGFVVGTLKTSSSPATAEAELIVLGSFASQTPEYLRLMKEHADGFADFLKRGGVLLQLTQSSEFDATLPFLPAGLAATRDATHCTAVRAVARHPLTDGIARDGDEPAQLRVAKKGEGPAPAFGSFATQEGFRVLAVDATDPTRAALLEAAVGRGRIVLTSLHLDKLDDADAKDEPDVAGAENRKATERFFDGLAGYVRAVRRSTAPEVVPTTGAIPDSAPWQPPIGPKLAEPTPIAWGLGLSDMAEYARRPVTGTPDAEKLGAVDVFTLHGHTLRDARQVLPVSARRGDLPAILAFRLPSAEQAAADIDTKLHLHRVSPVSWKGRVSAHAIAGAPGEPPAVFVQGDYELGGRAKVREEDKHRIENGSATVRGVFDPVRGVMVRVRVELAYDLRDLTAKRSVKPKPVRKVFVWRLEDVRRARYGTFQHDVDAAIDAGVRFVRGKREESGRWKSHGKYDVGTTALMVLTLSACGVPRDDPDVAEPLAWLFTKHPAKNYDRSVALMAIDEAFTPDGEAEALRRGQPVTFRRELSDEQRAWCERTARELQRDCVGPGGFSYPIGSQYIQRADMSNTQYAILGLHAATKLGVEIEEGVWLGVLRTFDQVRDRKSPRGSVTIVREGAAVPRKGESRDDATTVRNVAGFRYTTAANKSWSSMTCAGIASLSIARSHLERLKSAKLSARVEKEIDAALFGAWAWLDEHWAVDRHPEKDANDWVGYYLYSLERAALLDRVKRIGGKDWYFEGACQLMARRGRDGGWKDNTRRDGASSIVDTCFALLFLKRATAPITGR